MLLPHEHVEAEAAEESEHWVEHEQEASGESGHQQQILQKNVNKCETQAANVMIMLSQNVSPNLLHPPIQ